MKFIKRLLLLFSTFTFFFLTGFDKTELINISNIETTIIKAENVLRYDIKLKNSGTTPLKSEFDYPGQHYYGIELVVRPNKKLASKMEMVEDSKFFKMLPMGSGATGSIEPGTEGSFHLEYKIKKGANLKEVKKLAFDSTLLILDGVNIIKEIPLYK
ncbi:hypothetical protein E2K98_12765 [Bacillus salipaludis]|uniref:Uncharacterized protein n=1 Tax=Bacillus salipaludis TaxID=2547811 RepID=A0A4R5VST9_9BACI|nr:hypothetical protein [Bacillus salipaludis]TDK61755.1 hypothetical protein E2K98_12765 [Bacillus salipaludis]